MRALGSALHTHFARALRPYWGRVEAACKADRALRMREVLDEGAEGMVRGLHPGLLWESGTLTLVSRFERDIHLEGRGILLQPSYFCSGMPITLRDTGNTSSSPVIVYPVTHDAGWARADAERGQEKLRALLGRTRADLLEAVAAGGGSTSELALRLSVSAAVVSQHCSALRDTGLLITRRYGRSVHHCVTPLGGSLLSANHRPGRARAGRTPR